MWEYLCESMNPAWTGPCWNCVLATNHWVIESLEKGHWLLALFSVEERTTLFLSQHNSVTTDRDVDPASHFPRTWKRNTASNMQVSIKEVLNLGPWDYVDIWTAIVICYGLWPLKYWLPDLEPKLVLLFLE